MNHEQTGTLLVLVGPSGSGKGTVLKELLRTEKNTFLSVSATTREPRPGEEHGVHYYFLSREEFQELIQRDGLLEYASYCGNYYGTPRQAVVERLERGENVILEIEVQGAANVRRMYPEAVLAFILPPSLEELRRRLEGRGTEEPEVVARRLETAMREIPFAYECDYIVVNRDVAEAAEQLSGILRAQSCRRDAMTGTVDRILKEQLPGSGEEKEEFK